MAESSKWLQADEESIFSLETKRNLPGGTYELREQAGEKVCIWREAIPQGLKPDVFSVLYGPTKVGP